MLLIYVIFLLLPKIHQSSIINGVYHYAPDQSISYCSRKLNTTGQVGCSSRQGSSSGVVYFVEAAHILIQFLRSTHNEEVILALDLNIFLNMSLMREVRSSASVTGIIVFTSKSNESQTLPPFSESPVCPNSMYSYYGSDGQCNVTPSWNPDGSAYSSIDWPFPVVLIHDDHARSDLMDCYYRLNVNSTDDTRCSLEISNFMSAIGSSLLCSRRQSLMSPHMLESPIIYCDELAGVNIVLSATNTTVAPASNSTNRTKRASNSSILVLTRTDSRSMFERSAFASQGILPSVSILIAVAAHLMKQPAFKNLDLRRDLFFAFIDNEAYDFMGSRRLTYDLDTEGLVQFTGFPLGWDNLHSVIELSEIGIPEQDRLPTYYMNTDAKLYEHTKLTTDELMARLMAASNQSGQVHFVHPSRSSLPLPPTASVQGLLSHSPRLLPHLVLTDHDGPPLRDRNMESFLDTRWPPMNSPDADSTLLALANTLADALYRLVSAGGTSMTSLISHPTPGELMECFVNNPNCTLLRTFLNPSNVEFLISLGTPIPTQSYLPIDGRELKVSHIASVLLMGLTGERISASCPSDIKDRYPYSYFMGYYNGSEQCYRTLLDLATQFLLFTDDAPVAPAWVRSKLASRRNYVRWYRSASYHVDVFSIIIGVLLIVITFACVIRLRSLLLMELLRPLHTPMLEIHDDRDTCENVPIRT